MYVPILKNRTVEVGVLKDLFSLPLSVNTIPMIEVIQEKVQSNSKYNFLDILDQFTNREVNTNKIMVDISKRTVASNVIESVRTFLTTVTRNHDYYLEVFKNMEKKDGVIPIVSYNTDWVEPGFIRYSALKLRENFNAVGFRILPDKFDMLYDELKEVVNDGDYILLDIDKAFHINPALKKLYSKIREITSEKNVKSIILNSTKAESVTNVGLSNGEPIVEIDTSLRDSYNKIYGFDGFGDYAGISNTLPTSGGGISPAGIYYSTENNFFVGYRRNKTLSEFEEFIAPEIINSEYWKEYSEFHHTNCPGCKEIRRIVNETDPKEKKGKSQAKWKGITMSHYIYSIDEWFCESM